MFVLRDVYSTCEVTIKELIVLEFDKKKSKNNKLLELRFELRFVIKKHVFMYINDDISAFYGRATYSAKSSYLLLSNWETFLGSGKPV